METKNAMIITMSTAELNLIFKNFLKDNCGYDGTLSINVDSNEDAGVYIEVEIGEFSEEQEDKMSKFDICPSIPCGPGLGMDLFYVVFGLDAELINIEDNVKIIKYDINKF